MYHVQGEWINISWGDIITYKRALIAPAYRDEAANQEESQGPYQSICVSCEDWGVQVRADGWMGNAILYNVWTMDIISIEKRARG